MLRFLLLHYKFIILLVHNWTAQLYLHRLVLVHFVGIEVNWYFHIFYLEISICCAWLSDVTQDRHCWWFLCLCLITQSSHSITSSTVHLKSQSPQLCADTVTYFVLTLLHLPAHELTTFNSEPETRYVLLRNSCQLMNKKCHWLTDAWWNTVRRSVTLCQLCFMFCVYFAPLLHCFVSFILCWPRAGSGSCGFLLE